MYYIFFTLYKNEFIGIMLEIFGNYLYFLQIKKSIGKKTFLNVRIVRFIVVILLFILRMIFFILLYIIIRLEITKIVKNK